MGLSQNGDDAFVNGSAQDLPDPNDCITHLKLMTAFSYLKDDISQIKDLFLADSDVSEQLNDQRQAVVPEKRWTIYISRAVRRFELWANLIMHEQNAEAAKLLQHKQKGINESSEKLLRSSDPFKWTVDNIPPLDVLMVFHAFMLNPRWFLDDCLRLGWISLWKAGMPWDLLDRCIDDKKFECVVPETTKTRFARVGIRWDNLNDSKANLFQCSVCSKKGKDESQKLTSKWVSSSEFTLLCALPCHNLGHLQEIQTGLLRNNLDIFESEQIPLRATFLNDRGRISDKDPSKRSPQNFAARLLTDKKIRAHLETPSVAKASGNGTITSTFDQADRAVQAASFTVRKIKSDRLSSQISPAERYSLARTRIAYSEYNGSSFSIDLTAAVLRQGKFVNDMRDIAWIFSPNLSRTVENLLGKYEVFLDIMRQSSRDQISVPTLAVDLAWHTHQLSPEKYFRYCIAEVNGMLVDHDDRVGEGDLKPAFKRTSEKFKELTEGGNYEECMCWHCAALDLHARELHASAPGGGTDPKSEQEGHVLSTESVEQREQVRQRAADTVRTYQLHKFNHNYERYQQSKQQQGQPDDANNRSTFMRTYNWLYADYAPDKSDENVVQS